MFSYNDGKLHNEVLLSVEEQTPVALQRFGNTTQFVAPNALVQKLKHRRSRFRIVVDSRPTIDAVEDPVIAEKCEWLGNPGICDYYGDFLEALVRSIPGSEAVSASYLGYNYESPQCNERLYLLDDQVSHHLNFLEWFKEHRAEGRQRLIVLGHSVGSWILQRIATQRRDIDFVGLLAPTVRNIAHSERGQKFVYLTRYVGPSLVWGVVHAINWVPFMRSALSRVVDRLMPASVCSDLARQASLGIATTSSICYQIFGLALEEMQRIDDDIEPAAIAGFWDSKAVWVCFAESDHWVSSETRESLIEYSRTKTNVRMDILPMKHAFCLRQSEEVAALTAYQINQLIPKR